MFAKLSTALLLGTLAGTTISACAVDGVHAATIQPTAINPDDFITIETGTLPVVLSAPHGGQMGVPGVAVRAMGTTVLDQNTYQVAIAIQRKLFAKTGRKAHLVAAKVRRTFIDFNRSANLSYEDPTLKPLFERYYDAVAEALRLAKVQSPAAALLIDIHGQSQNAQMIFRGTRNGQSANNAVFYALPDGLISSMNGLNLNVSPSTAGERENGHFDGGNIVASFGRNNTGVNAVQLEFGRGFRNTAADIDKTADKVSDGIIAHLRAQGAL